MRDILCIEVKFRGGGLGSLESQGPSVLGTLVAQMSTVDAPLMAIIKSEFFFLLEIPREKIPGQGCVLCDTYLLGHKWERRGLEMSSK